MNPTRKKTVRTGVLALLVTSAVFAFALHARAEANRVTFPKLEELIHYTTVRRGNVTEHISTTREALEAIQKGQPEPPRVLWRLKSLRGLSHEVEQVFP